jgi:hypothetical protein
MSDQHTVLRRCHEPHDFAHEQVIGMGRRAEDVDAA